MCVSEGMQRGIVNTFPLAMETVSTHGRGMERERVSIWDGGRCDLLLGRRYLTLLLHKSLVMSLSLSLSLSLSYTGTHAQIWTSEQFWSHFHLPSTFIQLIYKTFKHRNVKRVIRAQDRWQEKEEKKKVGLTHGTRIVDLLHWVWWKRCSLIDYFL